MSGRRELRSRPYGETSDPLSCDSFLLIFRSKMTDVYEGSLIRMFRRLEELLRQMAQAAKVLGNEELEKKFEESLSKVKRGELSGPTIEYANLPLTPFISSQTSSPLLRSTCKCAYIRAREIVLLLGFGGSCMLVSRLILRVVDFTRG